MDCNDIIRFWFEESSPQQWYRRDAEFDATIEARFLGHYQAASCCELAHWRDAPEGRLAEILVLDQFSRNLFRDSGQAFACDSLALALAQEAIRAGADQQLDPGRRSFLLMPFMHSESRRIHQQAITLFDQPEMENTLKFELRHKAIIDRFGRYPHRNEALGRDSTAEELAFLQSPGSSF